MKFFKKWPFALSTILLALALAFTVLHTDIAHGAAPPPIQPDVTSSTIHHYQTIPVFTNQVITPGQTIRSSFIKVQGYSKAILYVHFSALPPTYNGESDLTLEGLFSIDQVNDYPNTNYVSPDGNANFGIYSQELMASYSYTRLVQDVTGPYFRGTLYYGQSSPNDNSPSVTVNAKLYLIP